MIPLALYIHIPWCVRKCPYCDFNSHEAIEIPEEAYVDMLLRDLETHVDELQDRIIRSVFIGGGTPSLFSGTAISRLMRGVRDLAALAPGLEVTIEANPGTLLEGTMQNGVSRFAGYKEAGINRVSLGVQSFDDESLRTLGRIHNSGDALKAFEALRTAGIDNINIDLMHGLPGQSVSHALNDLATAIELAPRHLSWYQLTIEPNTVFHKRPPELPDDDALWDIYEAGVDLLAEHGYGRYEVSAFASESQRSVHNLNYWEFGDYIGIGAGAHGKLTDVDRNVQRTTRTRLPKDYLANPKVRRNAVSPEELPLEFLMNALRLVDGFSLELFEHRTGISAGEIAAFIDDNVRRGLLSRDGTLVKPTTLGINHLNDLLSRFDGKIIHRG